MERKRKPIQKSAVCTLAVTMTTALLCGCGSKENHEPVEAWNETEVSMSVSVTEAPDEGKSKGIGEEIGYVVNVDRGEAKGGAILASNGSDSSEGNGIENAGASLVDDSILDRDVESCYEYNEETGELVVDAEVMEALADKIGDTFGYDDSKKKIFKKDIEREIKGVFIAYEKGGIDEASIEAYISKGEWPENIKMIDATGNPILMTDLITSTPNDGTDNTGTEAASNNGADSNSLPSGDGGSLPSGGNDTQVAENIQQEDPAPGIIVEEDGNDHVVEEGGAWYDGGTTMTDEEWNAAFEAANPGWHVGTMEELENQPMTDSSKYHGVTFQ